MTKTISSQHYIDDEIVEAKQASGDYEVIVSPTFEHAGVTVRVVLDGHHSLAAAKADGVEPVYIEADATDDDRVSLLNAGEFDDFLEAAWMDGDYYDVETGGDVW